VQVQVTVNLAQGDERLESTPAELAESVRSALGAGDGDTVQVTVIGSATLPAPAPPTPPAATRPADVG